MARGGAIALVKPPLVLRGVSAGYGGRTIVSDLDLELIPGDVLGLLGPNGTGKSTIIKAITGQIPLRAGRILIAGAELAREPERAKARFGYAVAPSELPEPLTGQQYLELVASIRGIRGADSSCAEAVTRLELVSWLAQPIGDYSFGTRAKLAIAGSMIGAPPLLILDESLNGLDPIAAFEAKQLIRDRAASGTAILVATHVLEAIPGLCTRAALLAGGRILREWSTAALTNGLTFEADVVATFRALARHPVI